MFFFVENGSSWYDLLIELYERERITNILVHIAYKHKGIIKKHVCIYFFKYFVTRLYIITIPQRILKRADTRQRQPKGRYGTVGVTNIIL